MDRRQLLSAFLFFCLAACQPVDDSHLRLDLSALRNRAALAGISLDRYEVRIDADDLLAPIVTTVDPESDTFSVSVPPGPSRHLELVAERAPSTASASDAIPVFRAQATVDLVPGPNDVELTAHGVGVVRGIISVADGTPLPDDLSVEIIAQSPIDGITPTDPVAAPGGQFELVLGTGSHILSTTFATSTGNYVPIAPVTFEVSLGELLPLQIVLIPEGGKCDPSQPQEIRDAAPVCRQLSAQASGLSLPGLTVELASSYLTSPLQLVLTSDIAADFPAQLPDGVDYTLTLSNIPSGLACDLVGNTSGNIDGDLLVTISCGALSFNLGIDARGITEALTVTLTEPFTQVTINSDGLTTLAQLPFGTPYSITFTQPSDPTRHCTLNGADGALQNDSYLVLVCLGEVLPVHPTLPNWNDWVDTTEVPLAPCAVGGPFDTCVHSGELREVEVPDLLDCVGVTASDSLGVFRWTCDGSGSPVVIRSLGLRDGARLSDIVDFTSVAFLENRLEITDAAGIVRRTPDSVWWTNPFAEILSTVPSTPGIWLVTDNTVIADPIFPLDKTAVLVAPGRLPLLSQYTGPAVSVSSGRDVWIEGSFEGSEAFSDALYVYDSQNVVIRGVNIIDADSNGINLNNSSACRVEDVNIDAALYFGVSASAVNDSIFRNIEVRYAQGAFSLSGNRNDVRNLRVINDQRAANYPTIEVTSGNDNHFFDIRVAHAQGSGIWIGNSAVNTTLTQARIFNVAGRGIDLGGSENTRVLDALVLNTYAGAIFMSGGVNAVVANVTLANTDGPDALLALGYVGGATLLNVSSINAGSGAAVADSNHIVVHNFASLATDAGAGAAGPSVWRDRLTLGGNSVITCSSSDEVAFYDGTCTFDGTDGSSLYPDSESNAQLNLGADAATAFVGYVITDVVNPSHNGVCVATCDENLNWLDFENPFRAYMLHATFPTNAHRGFIGGGTQCCIFDWRVSDGSDLRDTGPDPSTLPLSTHIAGPGVSNPDCAARFWGGVFNGEADCLQDYLPSAVEIIGDGIGADDVLCNLGDDCVISRNAGAYQGQGELVFVQNRVIGPGSINLWAYAQTASAGSLFTGTSGVTGTR